jgi:hypothetical protein
VGDWFSKALDAGVARTDLAMREGRLWSLVPFEPSFLDAIGVDDIPDAIPLASYTGSDDRDRINLLAELVRKTLISMHHAQLRWSPMTKVATSGSPRVLGVKRRPERPRSARA